MKYLIRWSSLRVGALLLLLMPLVPTTVVADVVLEPVTIRGSIRVANETLDEFWTLNIQAFDASGRSVSSVNTKPEPGGGEYIYSMTVNVAQGTTETFVIGKSFTAGVEAALTNNRRFNFNVEQVEVTAGQDIVLDLEVTDPGFIQGALTVSGSGNLISGSISLKSDTGAALAKVNVFPETVGAQYTPLPFIKGENVTAQCYGQIEVAGNILFVLGTVSPSSVIAVSDEPVELNCDLPTPVIEVGSISGQVSFTGPDAVESYTVNIDGPVKKSITVTEGESYRFDNLPIGLYQFGFTTQAKLVAQAGTNQQFRFPAGSFPESNDNSNGRPRYWVETGEETIIDIFAQQAAVSGVITITNAPPTSHLSLSILGLVEGSPTYFGYAGVSNLSELGHYRLVASPGIYQYGGPIRMSFYNYSRNPTDYLNSVVSAYVAEDITLSSEAELTQDFHFEMGLIKVNFFVTDDSEVTFSGPGITGKCVRADGSESVVTLHASNPELKDVSLGYVRFYGLEGNCEIYATAVVDGAHTSFGTINLDIIAGADQEVGIGGPELLVETPLPGSIWEETVITVSGKVSDDVGVDSVTINGIPASLSAGNNPEDPNELFFSATIPLALGLNTIETIATDLDATPKQSSDSRSIERIAKVIVEVAAVGHLYDDVNGDGIQGDGIEVEMEPGLSGISVLVTDSLGDTHVAMSDDNGDYRVSVPEGVTLVEIDETTLDEGSIQTAGENPSSVFIALENADLGSDGFQVPTIVGTEGCGPGYWKNKKHFDAYLGFSPDDSFASIFEVDYDKTLLVALKTGGGQEKAFGRHAVAALLNASNQDVFYQYRMTEVIAMVQSAFEYGDFETVKDQFEVQNELGCPLE